MTLTHYKNNNWADSSTDKAAHNGLTAFGKDVVREINRLGVMVDISHVADKTFFDAIETTRAPLIASHSSSRVIANHARNMTGTGRAAVVSLQFNGEGPVVLRLASHMLPFRCVQPDRREEAEVSASLPAVLSPRF